MAALLEMEKPRADKKQDSNSKVVRVSTLVDDFLKDQANVGETPDDVLRRLLELPAKPPRGWRGQ